MHHHRSAIARIKAAGHAKGSASTVTRLGPAAEIAACEALYVRAMKSDFVGAPGSLQGADSTARRNPSKILSRLHLNEDGTFEPEQSSGT